MKKRFKKLDSLMKDQIPADLKDLVHQIFQLSPKRRISAAQALEHPYFNMMPGTLNKVSVTTKQSAIAHTTDTTSPYTSNNILFASSNKTQC